ncbi:hypothetical protein JCM10449v2_003995 [Rhodotorula kratochvilovae]
MLLDSVIQPSIISLFSSTSTHPTLLATCVPGTDAVTDSFVSLLDDATDSRETLLAWSGSSAAELSARVESLARLRRGLPAQAKDLDGQVLHLQAPDCRTTSVRWGSFSPETWRRDGLGVELPVLHFQLKHLEQTMYIDVAVVDEQDEVIIVRCSTFQVRLAKEFLPSSHEMLPDRASLTLTLLSSLTPPVKLKCTVGVEVHATCRLRRIWFSDEGSPAEVDEALLGRGVMPEMALFAAAAETKEEM